MAKVMTNRVGTTREVTIEDIARRAKDIRAANRRDGGYADRDPLDWGFAVTMDDAILQAAAELGVRMTRPRGCAEGTPFHRAWVALYRLEHTTP